MKKKRSIKTNPTQVAENTLLRWVMARIGDKDLFHERTEEIRKLFQNVVIKTS